MSRPPKPVATHLASSTASKGGHAAMRARARSTLPRPTTATMDYTADEMEFIIAMDRFKSDHGMQFPTWSHALAVLKSLGYRKVEPTV